MHDGGVPYLVSKQRSDLFKRDIRCLRELPVDNDDEDRVHKDENQEVSPADCRDCDWSDLYQKDNDGVQHRESEGETGRTNFHGLKNLSVSYYYCPTAPGLRPTKISGE